MKLTIKGKADEIREFIGDKISGDQVGIKQIVSPKDAHLVKPQVNESTKQKVDFRKTSSDK